MSLDAGPGARAISLPDGYYTVAAGKLVNAVTWLEMRSKPGETAAGLRLDAAAPAQSALRRRLFEEIGTPWLWSGAFASSGREPEKGAVRADTHFAYAEGELVGLVEFDGRGTEAVEITWFGLLPDATGRGLGRRMMAAALELAWQAGPDRVWLHTCSFDHPAAVRFYKACGFVPYAVGFEIMDDPRLSGRLPRTAAPHIPLVEP